jgi:hypothetical protein
MRRRIVSNRNAVYVIAVLIIIIAFLMGGGKWITGTMQGGAITHLNWVQIFIGLVLGFLLGVVVSKRKRRWM